MIEPTSLPVKQVLFITGLTLNPDKDDFNSLIKKRLPTTQGLLSMIGASLDDKGYESPTAPAPEGTHDCDVVVTIRLDGETVDVGIQRQAIPKGNKIGLNDMGIRIIERFMSLSFDDWLGADADQSDIRNMIHEVTGAHPEILAKASELEVSIQILPNQK